MDRVLPARPSCRAAATVSRSRTTRSATFSRLEGRPSRTGAACGGGARARRARRRRPLLGAGPGPRGTACSSTADRRILPRPRASPRPRRVFPHVRGFDDRSCGRALFGGRAVRPRESPVRPRLQLRTAGWRSREHGLASSPARRLPRPGPPGAHQKHAPDRPSPPPPPAPRETEGRRVARSRRRSAGPPPERPTAPRR